MNLKFKIPFYRRSVKKCLRRYSESTAIRDKGDTPPESIRIKNAAFPTDDYTNVTPKILSLIGTNLHNSQYHPLSLMKQRIVNYFYSAYKGRTGNPMFSVYDDLNPVVTIEQNFDSLLIPEDHVSRKKSDCYYINKDHLLRAHMTAHQSELIKMGLDNFLLFGDVYRRDEIDSTHYPVFHQCDAVRLFQKDKLSELIERDVFEKEVSGEETNLKQREHTILATREIEQQLKATLVGLAKALFSEATECRWVEAYFPFTHPSWELEIRRDNDWLEVLGCGIIRQEILTRAGAADRVGWAFGLGLDRLAMLLHRIPDIRTFWSTDTGFLSQFYGKSPTDPIIYKEVSVYPQAKSDISFWVPDGFESRDFHCLVREIGGDLVEQVSLVDWFTHAKTQRTSHCYRIIYRHLERTLRKNEVNEIHTKIGQMAVSRLGVEVR